MHPARYLFNRVRTMSAPEVLARARELGADHLRYLRRDRRAEIPVQRVVAPFEPAPVEVLAHLWECQPWHAEALAHLLDGEFEANGVRHRLTGENPWVRCPNRGHALPMIMGRRYLFARMYAEANMQFIGTLNRHYHLVHLAKAARLGHAGGDEVTRRIHDWIDKNPYLAGVNWSDCLNHAVRAVNWCTAFGILGLAEVDATIARSLHEQGTFIEQHLSFGSSAGNHLLGELWGLFFIGHCFPDLPRAADWRRLATDGLEHEVDRQFTLEGMHVERSVSYHRYLVEYLLLVLVAGRRFGVTFSADFEDKIREALTTLAEFVNSRGEVAMFGDCGHEITTDIHYLAFRDNDLYASALRLGAAVLDDRALAAHCPPGDDARVPWWIPAAPPPRETPTAARASVALHESGFFVIRDGRAPAEETALRLRCGPMGLGPLRAHAHADMLGFVLDVSGRQFVVDPGTYGYHFKGPAWRGYFRGTRAHNTLEVEGRDQALSGGAMIWLTDALGHVTEWFEDGPRTVFEGWHDGYLKQGRPRVRHVRRVVMDRDAGTIIITDRIEGAAARVAFPLHFRPEVEVESRDGVIRATREGITIGIEPDADAGLRTVRGEEDTPLGWYSPMFGIKLPATTIVQARALAPGEEMTTRIDYTLATPGTRSAPP